jgi:hypothetical protein
MRQNRICLRSPRFQCDNPTLGIAMDLYQHRRLFEIQRFSQECLRRRKALINEHQ